jgi:hypothetical protein
MAHDRRVIARCFRRRETGPMRGGPALSKRRGHGDASPTGKGVDRRAVRRQGCQFSRGAGSGGSRNDVPSPADEQSARVAVPENDNADSRGRRPGRSGKPERFGGLLASRAGRSDPPAVRRPGPRLSDSKTADGETGRIMPERQPSPRRVVEIRAGRAIWISAQYHAGLTPSRDSTMGDFLNP